MPGLPVYVRRITLAVITLCGLVGFGAAQGVAQLMELESLRTLQPSAPGFWGDTRYAQEAMAAMVQANVQGLESMTNSRALILLALSVSATLAFVAALRILRPAGLPREGVRRLLGGSAVACAILRTLDGAQMTALARRMGAAGDKVMVGSDLPGGYPDGMMSLVLSAASVGLTVLVAGGFLGVSMYYRSESMRSMVEAADRAEDLE